jgi:hypothetical protein
VTRFCLKSLGMLFVWTGLLMVFTSAGGSLPMLGTLLLVVCGAVSLATVARHGIARVMRDVSPSSPLGTRSGL